MNLAEHNKKKASRYRIVACLVLFAGLCNVGAALTTGQQWLGINALFLFVAAVAYYVLARHLSAPPIRRRRRPPPAPSEEDEPPRPSP